MENENYALWLLKNALGDELTYQQQAAEFIENKDHHNTESVDGFRESLKIANKRIPQLQKAIEQLSGLSIDKNKRLCTDTQPLTE